MFLGGLIMVPIMKPWEIQGIWDVRPSCFWIILSFFGTVIAFNLFLSSVSIYWSERTPSLLCSGSSQIAAGRNRSSMVGVLILD